MIGWFARNGVAANLLMAVIIVGGLITLPRIKREVFPDLPSNMITVSVLYPGAAPEEVEEGVCIRIEESIQGLDGVKRIRSSASENMGTVTVEALEGTDIRRLLDDVKSRVDAIDTFPGESEKPVIQELVSTSQVINVAVSAATDEVSLKRLGEQVRDEILTLPGITQAILVNVRPYEVSIEVSEEALRRYGLTFDQLATAVRRSSLDLPGGSVKTRGGEILLRTKGQAYRGSQFEDLVLRTSPDGSRIVLGDVATVRDGFAETDQFAYFDGKPSAMVQVFRVGNQDAIQVANTVKEYVEQARSRMPEGADLTIWSDESEYLRGRQDLLIRNGRAGFILVFLLLALFLRFRLAVWVSVGIPLSFLGAILLMPVLGVSINLISLFAFIIVLGIVVDDAIVVGESIYKRQESGETGVEASVRGTRDVALPVMFAILTTVAAFAPLLGVPGTMGQIMRTIPLIVIPTLLFSLVESKLILPNHLSHLKPIVRGASRTGVGALWGGIQDRVAAGLRWVIEHSYKPSLDLALRWRYTTVALFVLLLLATGGLIRGGWIKFVFFPKVEADVVIATLTLPQGTPVSITEHATLRIQDAAEQVRGEMDERSRPGEPSTVRHVLTSVGSQPVAQQQAAGPGGGAEGFSGGHLAEVVMELSPSEARSLTSAEVGSRWRELTGEIPDAVELTFSSSLFSAGSPIDIQLSGPDMAELRAVGDALKLHLAQYEGVFDITDSHLEGKQEIKLSMKPEAELLGLTLSDLAVQVRQAFYGEEAQRIQRGRDEVKVMVRYPEASRRSLASLETMRIRTPAGDEVPFSQVADAEPGRGYASIQRTDRRRTLSVRADIDATKGNANEILADVTAGALPDLIRDHPSVSYSLEGEQQEQRETMGGLLVGFAFALMAIYGLMAIPFKSYLQPLVVMTAIPFGLIGAIWGHVLLGRDLTILSMFGIVALTGVVVNDSIVLVDYINKLRRAGAPIEQALRKAGPARFRPILLTSLTTVAGLTPILLERSVQAQFLVPIAISLAFGVLFATFIILVMIPASYLILEDLLRLPARLRRSFQARARTGAQPVPRT